jgi:hypothetical protein
MRKPANAEEKNGAKILLLISRGGRWYIAERKTINIVGTTKIPLKLEKIVISRKMRKESFSRFCFEWSSFRSKNMYWIRKKAITEANEMKK